MEFVRDVIFFLATQGWQKIIDDEDKSGAEETQEEASSAFEAVNRLTSRFKVPLEATGVEISDILGEFREMLVYATQFISLSSTNYQVVWWKIFHSPVAADWSNVLELAQLLFALPVSNGKLERAFSTMKIIKVDKRSSLSNEVLDDLLAINVDQVNTSDFC